MKPTSFRLPQKTLNDLKKLSKKLDMTITQVVIVAIDRMSNTELTKKGAKK